MATAEQSVGAHERTARQGPQRRRARADLHRRHRRGVDRARVQPGRHPGVRGRRGRAAGADRGRARLRPDAADLDRLQRAEQGRPGLRHHVHLGDARVRAEDRLVRRLGHRRRRHPGHGEPGPGGRPVRASCCSAPTASAATRPAAGCCSVGIIWIVVMTAICYVGIEISANFQKVLLGIELDHAARALRRRPGQGRQRHRAGRGHLTPSVVLVQPVPHPQLQRLRQRLHPDAVHLLGLGHRGLGQRGDQGHDQDARAGPP